MRTALAAVLLLRDSGMRCHEAAAANRANLRLAERSIAGLWGEIDIVGKGGIARSVPMSQACYAALASHWADRAVSATTAGPLLSPLRRPNTARSAGKTSADGYSVRGLRQLVTRAFDAWLIVLTTAIYSRAGQRRRQTKIGRLFGSDQQ